MEFRGLKLDQWIRSDAVISSVWQVCVCVYIHIHIYINVIYLFAVLGLRCCTSLSLVVASKGYSLVAVLRFLFMAASLVGDHKLQSSWSPAVEKRGLSSCDPWA